MRFAIEGRIESVGAADIFLFLDQTQRTSVVAFERTDQETRVFFVDGKPVWCLSSKPQLQIDGRLAVGGALKLRDIETALSRQKAGPHRIPQALIAEGMATEDSMEADLRALAKDALRDVAAWTSGSFTIFDGVSPPPWAPTGVLEAGMLLIEAFRAQCQKETLQKEFVSRRCVLRPRALPRDTTGLSGGERAVLAQIDGEKTVEEIVNRSGVSELEALSAMHVLCALHLADLLPPGRNGKTGRDPASPVQPPAPGPPRKGGEAQGKGAVTNEFVEQKPKQGPPPGPPPAVTPPEPAGKASESTAQLPAISDGASSKALKHSLQVVSDGNTEDIVLTAAAFTVGRHPRNDLVLKDPRISSFHCRIEREGNKYAIVDLKSRNGTVVKSAKVDRAILNSGDVIQLGSTKITYSAA